MKQLLEVEGCLVVVVLSEHQVGHHLLEGEAVLASAPKMPSFTTSAEFYGLTSANGSSTYDGCRVPLLVVLEHRVALTQTRVKVLSDHVQFG